MFRSGDVRNARARPHPDISASVHPRSPAPRTFARCSFNGRPGLLVSLDVDALAAAAVPGPPCRLPGDKGGARGRRGTTHSRQFANKTNCKRLYSFLGPYINSCGAQGRRRGDDGGCGNRRNRTPKGGEAARAWRTARDVGPGAGGEAEMRTESALAVNPAERPARWPSGLPDIVARTAGKVRPTPAAAVRAPAGTLSIGPQ